MLYNYKNCHPKVKVINDSGNQLFGVISIDTEKKQLNTHSLDMAEGCEPDIDPNSPDEYKVYSIPYTEIIIKYEQHLPKLFVVSL